MVAFQQRCFNTCNFETYLYDLLLEEPEKLSCGSLASGRTVWAAVLSLQPQRAAVLRLHPSLSLLSKLSFNLSSLCLYCALKGPPEHPQGSRGSRLAQTAVSEQSTRASALGCLGVAHSPRRPPLFRPGFLWAFLVSSFIFLVASLTPRVVGSLLHQQGGRQSAAGFLEQRGDGSGLPGSDPWPPTPSSRGDLWRPLPLTTGSLPRLWGKSPGGQHRGPEGGWRLDVDLGGGAAQGGSGSGRLPVHLCVSVCAQVCVSAHRASPL